MVYVVDSNDREQIGEAGDDLHRMLNEDELRDADLLVFADNQVRPFILALPIQVQAGLGPPSPKLDD